MNKALPLVLASCGLLAACNRQPPPRPPLLSAAEVAVVAGTCGVPASAIVVDSDKARLDPTSGMSSTAQACVLKNLRARLPHASIEYGGKIKGQS